MGAGILAALKVVMSSKVAGAIGGMDKVDKKMDATAKQHNKHGKAVESSSKKSKTAMLGMAAAATGVMYMLAKNSVVIGSVFEEFSDILGYVGDIIGEALLPFIEPLLDLLWKFADWLAAAPPWLTKLIGVLGALTIAFMLLGPAMALLSANPIVLIVAAIIGLLMLLYYAWEQNWGGIRTFFEGVMRDIGVFWQLALKFIEFNWKYILKPVFDAVIGAAEWLWDNLVNIYFKALGIAWEVLCIAMEWAWDNILKPMFEGIAVVAGWLWDNILSPLFRDIGLAWDVLCKAMALVWDNVLSPVWDAVSGGLQWIWDNVLSPVFDLIEAGFKAMCEGIEWVWNNILKPIWDVLSGAWDMVSDIIGGAASAVSGTLGLQVGGLVTKTGFALVHAGERYTPAGASSTHHDYGGLTMNVYVDKIESELDFDVIARRTSRITFDEARRMS